jgi:hypothetical protein
MLLPRSRRLVHRRYRGGADTRAVLGTESSISREATAIKSRQTIAADRTQGSARPAGWVGDGPLLAADPVSVSVEFVGVARADVHRTAEIRAVKVVADVR